MISRNTVIAFVTLEGMSLLILLTSLNGYLDYDREPNRFVLCKQILVSQMDFQCSNRVDSSNGL